MITMIIVLSILVVVYIYLEWLANKEEKRTIELRNRRSKAFNRRRRK